MKKIFILSTVHFISFSFGQTKKKEIVSDLSVSEDNVHILKVNPDSADL